ncbi:MAG: LysM peptidoglycan-binding domain-containing protein, partial [Nitrososphaerales archaeon]
SAAALAQANGITNPDLIWVGQQLTVPGPGASGGAAQPQRTVTPVPVPLPSTSWTAPTAQPAPTATPTAAPAAQPTTGPAEVAAAGPKIHVVQPGETLSTIARKYGVSVGDLVAANGLGSPDVIGVGVRLLIPGQSAAASEGGATSALGKPTKFVASISQQRCWLYNGDTVIARWICSTGRSGSPSVPGTYKIQSKMPKAYGSTWDIWMPFWLGIYWAGGSENGIHGLPWNAKTGVQIWSGNVGKPITFGCIMLDNVNAKMLYDVAWIGMPVVIRP